jgi:hypothetical protein
MPITTPYDPLNPINDNISSGIQQSLMKNFWTDRFITNLILLVLVL